MVEREDPFSLGLPLATTFTLNAHLPPFSLFLRWLYLPNIFVDLLTSPPEILLPGPAACPDYAQGLKHTGGVGRLI